MEIQGCAFGRHEPEQSKPEPVKTSTPANVKVLYSEDGVEVYKNTDNIVPASSTKRRGKASGSRTSKTKRTA